MNVTSNSMKWVLCIAVAVLFASTAVGATFGTVIPIGGQASDIALDEPRGVLYVANFTTNQVNIVSIADNVIRESIAVARQPSSLALSPDGRWLVVAHYSNFAPPNTRANGLTIIDLNSNSRQTLALGFPPLGVAFGANNRALVVTTTDFILLEPASGATQVLGTIQEVAAKTLPVPVPNFPPQIVAASVVASRDGKRIFGLSDTFYFSYDVAETGRLAILGYAATPPLGPRVVSAADDGAYFAAGWGVFSGGKVFFDVIESVLLAEFTNPRGTLNVGSHAIDSASNTIYAQIPAQTGAVTYPPVLMIADADNLTVRDRLHLPENLAGKSVLNSAKDVMYAISDSGVTVLPVGNFSKVRRVQASQEDVIFRGNFCERKVLTQTVNVFDPSGQNTDFTLTTNSPGIKISPSSGTTPATVKISVDPSVYQNETGTVTAILNLNTFNGVNIPAPVRVLINNREPDQRGTFVNVPGKLVDMLADPSRNRFYVLRQDKNQVLVFDGTNYKQIAVLRTSNTPTRLAITFDRKYLLIGHDDSQVAYVYDLDTLQRDLPIIMPFGHYPRSIGVSGKAILVASRVAGPTHTIDKVDMVARRASQLPTLGVWENSINLDTVLTSSPNGSSIFGAMADGTLLLYSASADTFTAARKDGEDTTLSGAIAASSYDQFVVGNKVLNSSLVPFNQLETDTGATSGFVFVDRMGYRTTTPAVSSPGVIQRVDPNTGIRIRPTRMAESPLTGTTEGTIQSNSAFSRTLAALADQSAFISLTTSGFTVLPWNYDAAVAIPRMNAVVNAADFTKPTAPGGLISVFGNSLSPTNEATNELPLPTALGDSCLTANGVPVPMLYASGNQINGQMPVNVDGSVKMVLHTPGGVSNDFNLSVAPTAPRVFRIGGGGHPITAAIVRNSNNLMVTNSNPVHPEDFLVIYATGLGRTTPAVESGEAGPSDVLAVALAPVQVTLGGVNLPVYFAGLSPNMVGVYQINAKVLGSVPQGFNIPLVITQGGSSTEIPVRVVQ